MPNSWICVDANQVIRLVVDPTGESVRELWDELRRRLALIIVAKPLRFWYNRVR
jgi:hypothetical protein